MNINRNFSFLLKEKQAMGKCKDKKCKKPCCIEWININSNTINRTGGDINGLIISEPGNYRICENVDWFGGITDGFAITLASDDIVLDLGSHTIKQVNTLSVRNFAIQVNANLERITIQHGFINQFSGGGIHVRAGVDCITVDGIQFSHTGYNGNRPE